jgi:hypothetical protein
MLINITKAARLAGVSRQALHLKTNLEPLPPYFKENKSGKLCVDIDDPAWPIAAEEMARMSGAMKRTRALNDAMKAAGAGADDMPVFPGGGGTGGKNSELMEQAAQAHLEAVIHGAKIKEERAKQEEIKTAEIKRDLAPVYLIKYFFSFSEKIIQRIYRKPHDIEPQLSALFLAKEPKKATQLIIREIESIIVDVTKELMSEIEKEGFGVISGETVATGGEGKKRGKAGAKQ